MLETPLTMGPRNWMAIAALAAGLALAACGGDDNGGDGGGDSFAAEADAVCTDAAEESVRIFHEASPISGPEDARAYLEELQPARQQALDELEAIEPPEDLAARYDEFLAQRQEAVDQMDEGIQASDNPEDFAAARERNQELAEEAEAVAAEIGLEACAAELPPDAEEQARDSITRAATSSDPAVVCDELATDTFLENQFGGRESCAQAQEGSEPPESVEIEELSGVEGVNASATVTLVGGESDGGRFDVQLAYEDGTYKVDSVAPVEG